MGWRRDRYESRERRNSSKSLIRRNPRTYTFPQRNQEIDFYLRNYAFPPHIFDSYRLRVPDPLLHSRTKEDIAEILAHSLDESHLPENIVRHPSTNVLVDIHNHPIQDSNVASFGLYYIPLRRDSLDIESGRIVAVTILGAAEIIDSRALPISELDEPRGFILK